MAKPKATQVKRTKSKESKKNNGECCAPEQESAHPDHAAVLPRLNRIQGQIKGIESMINDRRYCVDILIQFRAAMAALRAIEVEVFEQHIKHCVNSALLSKDKKQAQEKIHELTQLLARRSLL